MQTLMISSLPKSLAVLVLSAFTLSACDESSDGKGKGANCISSLGSDFVRAFSQDPNDEPLDASELDLTLTPTKEPFDVPC
jgi:hypothetical protein